MSDIFISYSSEDRHRILPLVNALEKTGWSVFWNRMIPPGRSWRQVIGSAIQDSRAMVVVWTEKSIQSEWVHEEADVGRRKGILFSVLLDNVEPPFGFGLLQSANLVAWNDDSSYPIFIQLIESIATLLEPGQTTLNAEEPYKAREEQVHKRKPQQSENISKIFISYRRDDSAAYAHAIQSRLVQHFSRDQVFMDVDTVEPGVDFVRVIKEAVTECDILLAVIGKRWANLGSGAARLDDPEDFVRLEISTALERDIRVIPVLVDGMTMPTAETLPGSLKPLSRRNAMEISNTRFNFDLERLTTVVRKILDASDAKWKAKEDAERKADEDKRKGIENKQNRVEQETGQPDKRQVRMISLSDVMEQSEVKLEPGTVFRDRLEDGSQGPEMVVVPAGTFTMGDIQSVGTDFEKPVHSVHVGKAFAIGRYPITSEEYKLFASATGFHWPTDPGWDSRGQPAIRVAWDDAVEYAKWLSFQTGKRYRLPKEAEWEYAARAGTETTYWWGNEMRSDMANCDDGHWRRGEKTTSPVGSFQANPFGLYDTAGNVWEWVEDCWHENYKGAPTDGSAWLALDGGNCGQRVMRGGSWDSISFNLRTSCRERLNSDYRGDGIGFRLARDLD